MGTPSFNSQAPFDLEFLNTHSVDSFENSLWATYNRYALLDDKVDIAIPKFNCLNSVHDEGLLLSLETLNKPPLPEASPAQIPSPPSLSWGFPSRMQRQKSKSASLSSGSSLASRASIDENSADKHSQKRKKNRISARRCREKAKRKLAEMEGEIEAMQVQHEILMKEVKDLQYELIATQVECMEKISCGCADVKQALSGPVTS